MTAPAPGLTDAFWAAASRRELVRPVCRACGRNFFTPQVACPTCLSEDWTYEHSAGRGRVYSATVVHKPPSPGFAVPFRLGIVDLDEGWSILTEFVDGPDGRLPAIDTPVQVAWIERDGRTLPAFTEVLP
ncbi:Zn-ribbon domain-containing OB-fold protein [Pseudonocardia sp. N23]|uniref:Zn-ribbon domain-containing OB-fold protein n=1 Tax=Pseudonocardia sp. N23 TaxID=1987376 RepID=UPI000C033A97|nr:OB-fold domain-containing protein [Pseudonocardia sp. N23]GAY08307.1 protein of unknown function DUF35 [Pseudonocardia sp. N23]